MKKIVSISMPEALYKKIKEEAEKLGLTVSAYIVLKIQGKEVNGK